jgi:hypothetical protein
MSIISDESTISTISCLADSTSRNEMVIVKGMDKKSIFKTLFLVDKNVEAVNKIVNKIQCDNQEQLLDCLEFKHVEGCFPLFENIQSWLDDLNKEYRESFPLVNNNESNNKKARDAYNIQVHRKMANIGTSLMIYILQLKFKICFCGIPTEIPALRVNTSDEGETITLRDCVLRCHMEECYKLLYVLVNRTTKYERLKWNVDFVDVSMAAMKTIFEGIFADYDKTDGTGTMRDIPQLCKEDVIKLLSIVPADIETHTAYENDISNNLNCNNKRKISEITDDDDDGAAVVEAAAAAAAATAMLQLSSTPLVMNVTETISAEQANHEAITIPTESIKSSAPLVESPISPEGKVEIIKNYHHQLIIPAQKKTVAKKSLSPCVGFLGWITEIASGMFTFTYKARNGRTVVLNLIQCPK